MKFKPLSLLAGLLAVVSIITLTTIYYESARDSTMMPGNIMVLTMVNVNLILGLIFLLLLFRNLIKLYFERKNKVFGASFRTKLISSFVGFSLVPTVLLFVGTSGVLTNVIENWLSIQMEAPLRSSLEIAQTYYEDKKNLLISIGDQVASLVQWDEAALERVPAIMPGALNNKIYKEATGIYLIGRDYSIHYNQNSEPRVFSSNMTKAIEEALAGSVSTLVEPVAGGDMVSSIVPVSINGEVAGVVLAEYFLSSSLVDKMEAITRSFEEFHQLKLFKNPIKESYMMSILIVTLVILFSATWFGFYLGKGITVPILALADATQKVAKGNYDFKIDIKATSEIGLLVDSFNKMTEDLKKSKIRLEESDGSLKESYRELDRRRGYIETVLENIATGVMSLDREGRISTFNRSSEKILAMNSHAFIGLHFTEALKGEHLSCLLEIIENKIGTAGNMVTDIKVTVNKSRKTLRINISPLYDKNGDYLGSVIVFDDLSELIKAQKLAAWEGVARRIAHEIKNPLTPIQLSAERLRKKFFSKSPDFDDIFDKSTKIIVNEVHTLKTLVNEFSEFARLPGKTPVSININELIDDVSLRYKNIGTNITIKKEFDTSVPNLELDREQFKRVFINLIENSIEAMGLSGNGDNSGSISILTSFKSSEQIAVITVSDEGPGISESDIDKLFLPYFSGRKTGTGLGLAIVEKIISDHNGSIRGLNNPNRGASFIIEIPV